MLLQVEVNAQYEDGNGHAGVRDDQENSAAEFLHNEDSQQGSQNLSKGHEEGR